jgi:hypothetical protein
MTCAARLVAGITCRIRSSNFTRFVLVIPAKERTPADHRARIQPGIPARASLGRNDEGFLPTLSLRQPGFRTSSKSSGKILTGDHVS